MHEVNIKNFKVFLCNYLLLCQQHASFEKHVLKKTKPNLFTFETINVYLHKMVKDVLFFENLNVYIVHGIQTLLISYLKFHTVIFSVVNTSQYLTIE